ncbi:S26 family signal peptidase [Sphingomonas koreensis]|nr:S26 family signal peptidase [Sphingomonas koreensis]
MIDRHAAGTALVQWGQSLRGARSRRRRLARRSLAIAGLVTALFATVALPPHPLLVWNASASAPIGLYRVGGADLATGDMVIAWPPADFRDFAARRHYLPANVPLVKRVAAEPGDTICALGAEIFVNGRWIAERLVRDGAGRPMPWWTGCATLRHGALFLLMSDSSASFDGRYFGPTDRSAIVGKATPLWVR